MRDWEKIEEKSFRYFLLKLYDKFMFRMFYKRVYILGRENIPQNEAIIFAPNHENALMDALIVLFSQHTNPVFLARADIFQNKRIASILHLLKILPIYRKRDGLSNLQKNEEVFNTTVRVLKNGKTICIMPEGNHGDKHRLRNMVKGIFRIAFSAQEQKIKENKNVYIVPVGLYYHDYIKFNKPVLVNFGKPINVRDYYDDYLQNPAKTINQVKEELAARLSNLMIDIKNEEYYDTINSIREIYGHRMQKHLKREGKSFVKRFKAEQKLIRILHKSSESNGKLLSTLNDHVEEYKKILKKYKLKDWLFRKKDYHFIGLILRYALLFILLPVFLYGLINNFLPFYLPIRFTRKVKDKQFISSIRHVISVILFPLFYIIQGIIVYFAFSSVWIAFFYLLTLPFTGFAAVRYYKTFIKLNAKWRYTRLMKQKDEQLINSVKLRNKINNTIDEVVKKEIEIDAI